MSPRENFRIAKPQRRRALLLGYLAGAIWSIGNGLTTGTLIYYLAMDLGAEGLALSVLLAIPALVGLLRLFTPALIACFGTAKRTCLTSSLISYVLLLGLPAMALPKSALRGFNPLATMIALLCVHQLLEHVATVALWSWLADLVPRQIRGRYFGRRQVLQLLVLIPTLWVSGRFTDTWKNNHPETPLVGYAICAGLGAVALLGSLVPLVLMPATRRIFGADGATRQRQRPLSWQSLRMPFSDRLFRRLLLFGCWFSFFNGLTQSPQNIYPKEVLGLGVFALAMMQTTMRGGQLAASFWVGPFSDRYGNRPVLILSQMLVASGPLFFLLSSPENPYLLYGAWIVWAAYAGLNICLPNLVLKLSPTDKNAPYIATYFAVTSLFYAASTVTGGYLFDVLGQWEVRVGAGSMPIDRYTLLFWCGWITRSLGVLLLLRVIEPAAWRWREILARRRR